MGNNYLILSLRGGEGKYCTGVPKLYERSVISSRVRASFQRQQNDSGCQLLSPNASGVSIRQREW